MITHLAIVENDYVQVEMREHEVFISKVLPYESTDYKNHHQLWNKIEEANKTL